MAFIESQCRHLQIPQIPSQYLHPSSKPTFLFPIKPFKNPKNPYTHLSCSASKSLPTTELEILEAIADSDDDKILPCVRSYENDLARLTLVGGVDFEQALTAAASDGGEAAGEHIESGLKAMVVETLFPGHSDENSTVSTRLFLPARKVKGKAHKLRSSIPADIWKSTPSRNILAMTFRQVVLQQLWNFELVLFRPGSQRNMEDLENSREVTLSFSLGSSDEQVVSVLAEAVCMAALESTQSHFLNKSFSKTSNKFLCWFQKPQKIVSKDLSVTIHKLAEHEIVEKAKLLLEKFIPLKAKYKPMEGRRKYRWWTSSSSSKLEKIGGPEFSSWISEYLSAYRLQIDTNILKNLKLEGGERTAENRWEVLLTHSQMVGLAGILDMYYEDGYTLPSKQLSCGALAKFTNKLTNKNNNLLKMLTIMLMSGIILVTISVLGRVYLPFLHKGKKCREANFSLPSSEVHCAQLHALEATELEAICVSIIRKVKDAFGWPGEVITEPAVGAWTGELPVYLGRFSEAASSSAVSTGAKMETSPQDIASFQVVLSIDGKIIGFQPTSRVAVNHWAASPLAKELYGGRKLSPGLIEPGLKIQRPKEVVTIELLMSVNPDAHGFALARPSAPSL